MTTDTSEKGLETLIVADMVAASWVQGKPTDYDLSLIHIFMLAFGPGLTVEAALIG